MRTIRTFGTNMSVLLAVLIAVHVILNILGSSVEHEAVGDVIYVYKSWVDSINPQTKWMGISQPWVYPFIAWVPLLFAKILNPFDYLQSWIMMATLLNIVAVGQIVDWGRRKHAFKAAWYYVAFIGLLGPVAITRLDGISVSIAMIGLASFITASSQIAKELDVTRVALVWFTIATWLKVWPIGLILSILQDSKLRLKQIGVVAATSAAILGVGLLLGGNLNLLSFVTTQTDRGLQVESPISFIWFLLAAFHAGNAIVYFDDPLATWQVSGDGTAIAASLMSWALLVALAITALLMLRARKRKAGLFQIMALTALTATLDVIVFNKVGSPQYELWLTVPVAMGLIFGVKNWRIPTITTLFIAALTQMIYPIFYYYILHVQPFGIVLLGSRNISLIVLLIWSNAQLAKLGKAGKHLAV